LSADQYKQVTDISEHNASRKKGHVVEFDNHYDDNTISCGAIGPEGLQACFVVFGQP
jgi:hypothetical protein